MFSSCVSPHSPVCFFTSSMSVVIVSSCSISWIPAAAPCLPKTFFRMSPTCWLSAPKSFILEATCWIMSKVFFVPLARSCCTCLLEMPIASRLADVAVLISRIFLLAIVIMSRPLSLKMPLLVCCNIATSWSAPIPASWKVGAYCCILLSISPDRSAPLAKPSLITFIASSPDRW